ncbi:MAG: hypothetical protein HQK72_02070 [Desulfamplus sp.]|nr:hypothetical protein [Desulfamplus sp.]
MNDMWINGATIAEIQRQFDKYDDYWEINDYNFLGKKKMVSNRTNKIVESKSLSECQKIRKETKESWC